VCLQGGRRATRGSSGHPKLSRSPDLGGGSIGVRPLGDGRRRRLVFNGSSGEYRSAVLPSPRLRVEWLWQEPGPDYDEVLRTLGAG